MIASRTGEELDIKDLKFLQVAGNKEELKKQKTKNKTSENKQNAMMKTWQRDPKANWRTPNSQSWNKSKAK